jgi:hypothetical protein
MFAAAAGHYNVDMDIYRPSRTVSPPRVLRSSSGKIVTEVIALFNDFEPEKTWAKASESFVGLTTSDGHSIADFRDIFLKREYSKLLDKVLELVPDDMMEDLAISAIIEKLRTRSGATPHV